MANRRPATATVQRSRGRPQATTLGRPLTARERQRRHRGQRIDFRDRGNVERTTKQRKQPAWLADPLTSKHASLISELQAQIEDAQRDEINGMARVDKAFERANCWRRNRGEERPPDWELSLDAGWDRNPDGLGDLAHAIFEPNCVPRIVKRVKRQTAERDYDE